MSLMASLVTTSGIQQCFNVLIDIYHEFLLLFYCCILLEIKLTTTTSVNSLFLFHIASSIRVMCYVVHLSKQQMVWSLQLSRCHRTIPDSKVHGANMGPIWGRQDPGGPHVGHMNLAIWDDSSDAQILWPEHRLNQQCSFHSCILLIEIEVNVN